jgi:bifunctional DNA-binding transcriptional regulator/antitoxin component of YhaV-PrlF toxin-antitoxin module
MNVMTLNSKYQLTIPEELRDKEEGKPGQEFALLPRGDALVLVPVPKREELFGIAKGASTEGFRDRNDRY